MDALVLIYLIPAVILVIVGVRRILRLMGDDRF